MGIRGHGTSWRNWLALVGIAAVASVALVAMASVSVGAETTSKIALIPGEPITAIEGNGVEHVVAQFTDATNVVPSIGAALQPKVAACNDADTYTASINWGDGGTPTTGGVSCSGQDTWSVAGSYTYKDSGTFKVTVTVNDSDGDSATGQTDTAAISDQELAAVSAANVKVGNFLRPADTQPLAVINQMAPVYVTFAIPQRVLVDLREAMAKDGSKVIATIPGHQRSEEGKVAMVENAVDATTGMVTVRGMMDNGNETLWPGTLVSTKLIIRTENSVVVPTIAVQRSQNGNYVFVVKDGAAKVQPVKVDRTSQGVSVISEGLSGDESVVIDGQLLLLDGTRVEPRPRKAGA